MLNILKLKGKIAENNLTMSSLAKKLDINRDTLYRRLRNNGEKLFLKDINAIIKILNLSYEDVIEIFLKV
ncbi:putative transcriptional regulator [Peptoniphilus sp. ING2-D1G]|nr:putative transcriptional regulator [Peptoniphilus sp. ING2-D1G]